MTDLRADLLKSGEEKEWDQFVLGHASGTVYHSIGWRIALEHAFSHYKGHILTLRDPSTGALVGGLPIYQVRSALIGNRLVSPPFACYCDPLLSSRDDFAALAPSILALQRDLKCRRVELRVRQGRPTCFEPFDASAQDSHHYVELPTDPRELLSSFSKTSVRQMIERSKKVGVVVRDARDVSDVDVFHELLTKCRKRLGLPAIPAAFFHALWQVFWPGRITILVATLEGEPVAGILTLRYGGVEFLEYAADDGEHRSSGANQRLYWEAIRAACDAGCHRFSLGRTLAVNEGLKTYKRRWGAREENLMTLTYPASPGYGMPLRAGGRFRSVAQDLIRASPVGVYRVCSGFFYQHWG